MNQFSAEDGIIVRALGIFYYTHFERVFYIEKQKFLHKTSLEWKMWAFVLTSFVTVMFLLIILQN